MFGLRQTWSYTLALAISGAGCAHMMETKTIEKFATELKRQDLDGMKEHASEEFAGRALRNGWREVGDFLGTSIREYWERYPLARQLELWAAAGIEDVEVRRLSLGGGVVMWGRRA